MAADYLRRIRRVQPEGPYHLLGWSLGASPPTKWRGNCRPAGRRWPSWHARRLSL
ncbi:thioesterase domain-containing protein [Microbulbifer halophilus]|uniref:thioesterase domain-containing protein n=1 Tax=Microbulbifer halophilus TaxID=453963 RepID=UPI0036208571